MKTIINTLPERQKFLRGEDTFSLGYPWLTYGAIIALELLLKPHYRVLELGSGGSTIFFSRRCCFVKSYDNDIKWVNLTKLYLDCTQTIVEFVVGDLSTQISSLQKEQDLFYDLLLVDSGPSYRERLRLMQESLCKLKQGGYMIVDNYNQRYINRFDYTGWDVYTFDDMKYSGRGTKICKKL
jgi:predicted O-methyltransferase YrrM